MNNTVESARAAGVHELSAEERAEKLGCLIRAKISNGEFRLSSGYVAKSGRYCVGCALGALACSLMGNEDAYKAFQLSGQGSEELRRRLDTTGLVSREELYALEAGYEAHPSFMVNTHQQAVERFSSPFFKLGMALSIEHGHYSKQLFYYRRVQYGVEEA